MSEKRKPRAFTVGKPTAAEKTAKTNTAQDKTTKPASSSTNNPQKRKNAASRSKTSAVRKPKAISDTSSLKHLPLEAAETRGLSVDDLEPIPTTLGKKTGFTWSRLFWGSLAALLTLGLSLALDQLVRDLFARNTWLGWVGLTLTAIFVLAFLGLAIREIVSLMRLRSLAALQEKSKAVIETPQMETAQALQRDLVNHFAGSPAATIQTQNLKRDTENAVDARDIIELSERHLLGELDAQASEMVSSAAKRVSVVTAISPRAVADIAYVLFENLRLISRLSKLYGGRTGTIGFFRLAKNVVMHLAATGAISIGDGLFQQMLGHGLSAKLSARLGEGVINGLLTARIGISAMDICRPMPFNALKRPKISDFLTQLTRFASKEAGVEKSGKNK